MQVIWQITIKNRSEIMSDLDKEFLMQARDKDRNTRYIFDKNDNPILRISIGIEDSLNKEERRAYFVVEPVYSINTLSLNGKDIDAIIEKHPELQALKTFIEQEEVFKISLNEERKVQLPLHLINLCCAAGIDPHAPHRFKEGSYSFSADADDIDLKITNNLKQETRSPEQIISDTKPSIGQLSMGHFHQNRLDPEA